MEGEGKGQRDEGREYRRPQRRCGEPERPRGGCRLCPRRCREPGRRRGTQARRGAADTGSRRGAELGMKAGGRGRRRAGTPLQPAAGSRGGSEVPRRIGAGGAEGEGAAAGSRDLGEGVGRTAPRCAAGTTRTN